MCRPTGRWWPLGCLSLAADMRATLRGRSLVAVFAHPDDESLACGGLLARCVAEGMHVKLVCVTRGEDGHDVSGIARGTLAATRETELAAAADVLGIETVVYLGFEDGMLPWIDGEELDASIAASLARWSPDAVVTFDEDGLYWHPDHIAVHRATTLAVSQIEGVAPALYYASLPDGCMRRMMTAVGDRLPEDRRDILGVHDIDAFGTLAPAPDFVLDVGTTAARKLAAIRCHQSQAHAGPFSVLSDDEAVRYLGLEHLRRAPVGNTAAPLLELLTERT